jgi:RNA polymerase-binding transcription factor DksA
VPFQHLRRQVRGAVGDHRDPRHPRAQPIRGARAGLISVAGGEEVTPEERKRVEARLDARLEELEHTRAAMRRAGSGMRDTELSKLDNHPGDRGTELHDEELDETTEIFLEEEERRIAEARRALAAGRYGTCSECGGEIPRSRLEARPEATLCIDCQRHFDGRQRQRTPA